MMYYVLASISCSFMSSMRNQASNSEIIFCTRHAARPPKCS
uniref:Uncharacterized protein n=1 Tax=Arundo donax TaxID=35708 RepID=A0A0A9B3B7_ARUDO